ncbi:MAG: hypothetical protein ACRDNF_24070 [Streptosporangiaceae bacterium]
MSRRRLGARPIVTSHEHAATPAAEEAVPVIVAGLALYARNCC